MRILMVNKFYDLRGGAERVMFNLRDGLLQRGHEVIPFAMADERNEATPWSEYFVPQRDYQATGLGVRIRQGLSTIHDPQARRHLEILLDRVRPDVAHLHNIYHQLSPSILKPLRQRGIPVVMTLHDYKLACPSYTMFRDGHPCEKCVGMSVPFWCAVHACSRGSRAESIVLTVESTIHRLSKVYLKGVDRFICPSRYLRDVMLRQHIPAEALTVIPNAPRELGEAAPWSKVAERPSVLYNGRLTTEKGLDVLIDAAREVPGVEVIIAGDGPLEEELRRRAQGAPWIRLVGRLDAAGLSRERERAWAMVLPSVCTENAPLSVLEGFAAARGALVSDRGGLVEMVDDRIGRRIAPADRGAWRAALAALQQEGDRWRRRGEQARRRLESEWDPQRFIDAHEELYRRLLQA